MLLQGDDLHAFRRPHHARTLPDIAGELCQSCAGEVQVSANLFPAGWSFGDAT